MSQWFTLVETAYAQGAQAKGPTLMETILPFFFIFVVMYLIIIRPQQKKAKEHATLLETLKNGDEVVTTGGIIGRVRSVAEGFVTVDIANNTSIKVLKSHIANLTKKDPAPAKKA